MLFFNYLRYQLGFPLHTILGAGGTTLADAYKYLTGRGDDPLVAMNALLDKHFPPGGLNLRNNNPFPLLDADKRTVTLGFDHTSTDVPRLVSGPVPRVPLVAHVSPFVTCPAKDYTYRYINHAVTWTIDATAIGFLVPGFQWTIHLTPLIVASNTVPVTVAFDVPQPATRQPPRRPSAPVASAISSRTSAANPATRAVLLSPTWTTTASIIWTCQSRSPRRFSPDHPTVAKATIDFDALDIRYEDAFYQDQRNCVTRFEHAIPALVKQVNLVAVAPDPLMADHSRN